jgi:Na+/proline symporter
MGPGMAFDSLGVSFFAAYLALMLGIGWWASRQQKTSEDLLVAGRNFTLWVMVLGNVAAMMHGGAIVSHIALAAQMGGVAVTVNLAYVMGFAVILFFYARKLRNSRGMTLPDYMGDRFDSRLLRGWSAGVVVCTSLLVVVGQIKVMGYLFQALAGLPIFWGQLVGTLIFVAYVSMGGLLAVVWTNIAQFFLMWIGILLLWPAINDAVGGWSEVLAAAESAAPGWLSVKGVSWTWGYLISWYMLVFVAYSTRLELVTKLFAARDERVARFSLPWTALLVMLFLTYGGLYLGAAARVLVWDQITTPDQAFPALVELLASPWVAAFALTAVASAAMSTTDSLLLMSGAAVSHDIIRRCIFEPQGIEKSERFYLTISRLTILLIGLFAFIISLTSLGLIWEIVSYSLALVASAFFFPLTAGLISWRISRMAAIVASVGGVIVAVLWTILALVEVPWALLAHPVLPGMVASGTGMVVTQVFSRPVSKAALVKFFPELG